MEIEALTLHSRALVGTMRKGSLRKLRYVNLSSLRLTNVAYTTVAYIIQIATVEASKR